MRWTQKVSLNTLERRRGSTTASCSSNVSSAVDRCWWDPAVNSSRVRYALNTESRFQYTLGGDEMGVEQAQQPLLSSSSKVSGMVDCQWDIAIGSSHVRYMLNADSWLWKEMRWGLSKLDNCHSCLLQRCRVQLTIGGILPSAPVMSDMCWMQKVGFERRWDGGWASSTTATLVFFKGVGYSWPLVGYCHRLQSCQIHVECRKLVLKGDETGVEQAWQPPLLSSSKVLGMVDHWWDIAVGSQIHVECWMLKRAGWGTCRSGWEKSGRKSDYIITCLQVSHLSLTMWDYKISTLLMQLENKDGNHLVSIVQFLSNIHSTQFPGKVKKSKTIDKVHDMQGNVVVCCLWGCA